MEVLLERKCILMRRKLNPKMVKTSICDGHREHVFGGVPCKCHLCDEGNVTYYCYCC